MALGQKPAGIIPPEFAAPVRAALSLEDVSQARVMLFQSGRMVHVSLLDLFNMVIAVTDGDLLLLSGDEQVSGFDGILLTGDMQDTGYDLLQQS